jgi:hypothetical protein
MAFPYFVISGFSFPTFRFLLTAEPQNYYQLTGRVPAFSRSFVDDFLDVV